MRYSRLGALSLLMAGLLATIAVRQAVAAPVNLSYSETSSGTTGSGTISALPVPGQYTYTNSYSSDTGIIPISDTSFGFYDDYVFSITGATADSVTSTINLGSYGITNLSERLYSTAGNPVLPVLGAPVGGANEAWTTSMTIPMTGITAQTAVLAPVNLTAGTYVLEVRGTADSGGGNYTGSLNLTPVPIPAALPLLLSGLSGLGLWRRRV